MSAHTQSLAARLTSLSESNKSTQQLINRLARLHFQPGSAPQDSADGGGARAELSSDIHDSLKEQEEELELLASEIDDATGASTGPPSHGRRRQSEHDGGERKRLSIQLARLTEDLKQSRAQFRRAQLQAKRNAELAKQQERDLLFAGIREGSTGGGSGTGGDGRRAQQHPGGAREKLTAEELTVNASSDVTAALRRTRALLQTELSRSEFAQETLEESSRQLADLGDKYTDLDSLLSSSRTLLSTLVRSQKSDTWYLETALYILLATIAWLVFRRFLYGPFWWLLYLPLKLTYRLLTLVFSTVGLTGAGAAATTTSRRPLIVQPSAKARAQPRVVPIPEGQQPNIPVGRGGYGAGQRPDPSVLGSLSQTVGQMAEASREAEKPQADAQQEEGKQQGEVRRGDGTVLPDRKPDQPRNPKKKVWDEEAERAKAEGAQRQRDEL